MFCTGCGSEMRFTEWCEPGPLGERWRTNLPCECNSNQWTISGEPDSVFVIVPSSLHQRIFPSSPSYKEQP